MSLAAFSNLMWGVSQWMFKFSDECFKAADRLEQTERQYMPSPSSRLPSFFKMVQMGADSLGLRAMQDDEDPRLCSIAVPCLGRMYLLCVYLASATEIVLRVPNKVPMSKCPRGTAEWLERRSNDLPWGWWTEGGDYFQIASSVKVDAFLENVENAATLMVGEAAAFDTALINKGYA